MNEYHISGVNGWVDAETFRRHVRGQVKTREPLNAEDAERLADKFGVSYEVQERPEPPHSRYPWSKRRGDE